MPTYEYACRACGHTFDVVQAMSEEPLKECPACGGDLRKVFHPASIAFKGSGFYATDNRKKPAASGADGTKKETKPSGSDTGSGDAKGDAKGDSKKDAKKDAKPSTTTPSAPSPKPASKP